MGKEREWYRITAKEDKTADISIYEQIGIDWWDGSGVSAKKFINELNGLDVETMNLYINSPGGDVFDGNAIYNALKRHKAKVNVIVDGIAASIASVVAMAGDNIEMPENAMMMIHDPSGGVWGTADDMLNMAEALEKVKLGLVASYRDKSGMDDAEISKLMKDISWITAAEAVEMGLADKMTEKIKIQANFKCLTRYGKVPEVLQMADKLIKSEEESDMPITREMLEKDAPELMAQIQDAARAEVTIENFNDQVKEKEEAAAQAERDRIMAVYKEAHSEESAKKFAAVIKPGATMSDMMAFAQDKAKAEILAKMQAEAPETLGAGDGDGDGDISNLVGEDKWKTEYAKSKDLQNEFASADVYVAFMKAEEAGLAKIAKKN